MEIVTGKRGFPHVSSYEMQTFNKSVIGDSVLFDVGSHLQAEIVSNNLIRINSGCIMMQGVYCIIPYGTYDEIHVESVNPGTRRKDVIYMQYERDLETGLETVIITLEQGEPVTDGEPVAPTIPQGQASLWEGGNMFTVSLYEVDVTFDAISVSEIYDFDGHLLTDLSSVGGSVGDLTNLNTTSKTSIVSAVNEVNGKANANAVNIVTMLEDVDTLEGAVFSERKVYTERFATNVTGSGRLMLTVSTWKKDTACVNVRFSNRVTGGFTDVVLMIKQNSYYTKCKQMYNDGISISKIYRGSNNTTFDFEIPTSTNNAYDVYVTAPVWVSGTYEAQSTLDGTEMTIDSFDYDEMELTVGNLSNLSTTTHSNIVAAINEVNGKIVDTDYAITEYSVPYVSGNNTIFMIRSNDVSVVGDEEYLLNVEIIKSNGDAVEMLFRTTDDSVLNNDVFIFNKPQDSGYEAVPISKVEDATSFFQGNNADLWITLEGTPDVTVRLTHHKSKTYTVVSSPAMPSGTGRELPIYVGNFAIWSKASYNGQTGENVVKTNSGVSLITDGIDGDIGILNRGEGDSQFANVRVFTPEGDVRINNNYVGKTSLSGIGDGTITGAIAFSENDGEEVSGEVITVTDAIDANAVDVIVDIEPVQDLHGYDKPWVGGAGKNKLPNTATSGTVANVTYTVNSDGTIIANGTSNSWDALTIGTVTLPSGTYWLTSGITSSDNYLEFVLNGSYVVTNGLSRIQFTLTQSTEITVKLYARPNKTATNLKLYPMIYLDSETDTTYAPYENICPISAVTETGGEPQIEIQRVGKNLFDNEYKQGYIINDSGIEVADTSSYSINGIKVIPSQPVYIGFGCQRVYEFDRNDVFLRRTSLHDKYLSYGVFTPSADCYFIRVQSLLSSDYYNKSIPQIELGNQATDFEPYQGETYIIKTGDNVYGAHHDVTTGKMVVTHGIVDLGDLTWSYRGESRTGLFSNTSVSDYLHSVNVICICENYKYDGTVLSVGDMRNKNNGSICVYVNDDYPNNSGIYIVDERYTDATAFKTAVTGVKLVYELATPQTINLTPQQIKLIKGTNTLSSNAQNINLTYLKDNAVGKAVSIVEKEIEPQIEEIHNELDTKLNSDSIAPVENGDTASTSYAVGSYIVRNNNLYKVISAISQGATFTNNNIQQTTVMAEILSRL